MIAIEPVKILLFYKFTPLADPEAIRLWQRTLCENLELTGRIIISKDGINGTVGGSLSAIKKYRRSTCEFAPFRDIDFKWSDGIGGDFPRLAVRVRDEIVTFGVPEEIVVDHRGIVGGATHLTPHELHTLVDQRGDEIVFFDGRNEFESRIGRFKNAVIPNIKTTPEFVQELETGKFDHLKDKPIVTYCTGGIRCEVLSVIMKNRGFQEVYQMAGGIVRYAETFGDLHLWEGSLYVFDSRLKMDFSANPQILGQCQSCDEPTNQFHNCSDPACHTLTLVCDSCWQLHPLVQCETCRA